MYHDWNFGGRRKKNWMSKVCYTISGIIIQICMFALPGMILIMIFVCICEGVADLTRWKDMWLKTRVLSLLSSQVWLGNFSKHSKCLGRILEVKISQPTRLQSQKTPKTFGIFQKISAAAVAGKEAKHVLQATYLFISWNRSHPYK